MTVRKTVGEGGEDGVGLRRQQHEQEDRNQESDKTDQCPVSALRWTLGRVCLLGSLRRGDRCSSDDGEVKAASGAKVSCGLVTKPASWTGSAVEWTEPAALSYGDGSFGGLKCLCRLFRLDLRWHLSRSDNPSALLVLYCGVLETLGRHFVGRGALGLLNDRPRPQLPPGIRITTTDLGGGGLITRASAVRAGAVSPQMSVFPDCRCRRRQLVRFRAS